VECGYESRVVRVLCQPDVAGWAGMSFTYRLNSSGETSPAWTTPVRIARRVDVADCKDVWNIRLSGNLGAVFTRQGGKFRMVCFKSRPLTHDVEGLGASTKTAPVSLFSSQFGLTLSTRRVSCSVVMCLGRTPTARDAAACAHFLPGGP
jgi:hypothetical protein